MDQNDQTNQLIDQSEHVIEGKVILLGAQGVGKTSICQRTAGQYWSAARPAKPTIGVSLFDFQTWV